jgi:glycosyltransferase involved in cell wall biosynthesis
VKICLLTPYYPPFKGGISSYLSSLRSKLDDFNFDTCVVARYGNSNKRTYVIKWKIWYIIKSYFILHNEKPDVIHAHSNWYTLVPSIIYKIFNRNTRLVFTFHTEPTKTLKGIKKKTYQQLLSMCDTVTFVSESLKDKLEENYRINTNKKVIYPGASAKEVYKEDIKSFTRKFSLEDNEPIISFVGPLVWKQKVEGVKILIRSFKLVKAEYPEAKLLVIGDGKYREELEQLTKELDVHDVIFTGFLDNVFVPLKLTDIYAQITLQEGYPISLLEAMSMGKPLIATKVGGIPEIIKNCENGILIEADPEIIGKELISLYKDKAKMKTIGENAKITIEKRYNWESITNEYIDIYKEG